MNDQHTKLVNKIKQEIEKSDRDFKAYMYLKETSSAITELKIQIVLNKILMEMK